ncbi:MAG: hypothetical protein AABZ44_06545 [Elusimicrobiota bacterium]
MRNPKGPLLIATLLGAAVCAKHLSAAELPIKIEIMYEDSWGEAVADEAGIDFYHDALGQGIITHGVLAGLPRSFWGSHDFFYAGEAAKYKIILRNLSNRPVEGLSVTAFNGLWDGSRASSMAGKSWNLKSLEPGQITVLTASAKLGKIYGGSGAGMVSVKVAAGGAEWQAAQPVFWCSRPEN